MVQVAAACHPTPRTIRTTRRTQGKFPLPVARVCLFLLFSFVLCLIYDLFCVGFTPESACVRVEAVSSGVVFLVLPGAVFELRVEC